MTLLNLTQMIWLLRVLLTMNIAFALVAGGGIHPRGFLPEDANFKKIVSTDNDSKKPAKLKHHSVSERTTTQSSEEDDDKKTLAQQILDGKYGLIQTELFSKPIKRPGIISYEVNPEVPKDNVNDLGGLQPGEIWLAENHLLVLKGGGFSEKEQGAKDKWPPIDNYLAPKRPVKIPPKPKVPPPFPVQLTEGGPLQFIEGDSGPTAHPVPPPPTFNLSQGNGPWGNRPAPFPFPPFFYATPPPGLFPLAGNLTDVDEDDPRLYYPPSYDFVYHKNESSHVPAGPLVPGIVLPPPPDFFAPLVTKGSSKPPTKKTGKHDAPAQKSNKPVLINFTPSRVTPTQSSPSNFSYNKTKKPKDHSVINLSILRNISTTANPAVSSHNFVKSNMIGQTPLKLGVGDWVPIVGPSLCMFEKNKCVSVPVTHKPVDKTRFFIYNITGIPDLLHTKKDPYINEQSLVTTLRPLDLDKQFFKSNIGYDAFSPIIVNPTYSTPSYRTIPKENPQQQRETFYFYQEPQITEAKVIDADQYQVTTRKPYNILINQHQTNKFETNTISPASLFRGSSVRRPKVTNTIKPSRLHIYEQELKSIPLGNVYSVDYLFNAQPVPKTEAYEYTTPVQSGGQYLSERPLHLVSVNHRNPANHKVEHQRPKGGQTPVFEYSFSAPGYGTLETPKISPIIPTTNKPLASPGLLRQVAYLELRGRLRGANNYNQQESERGAPVYWPSSVRQHLPALPSTTTAPPLPPPTTVHYFNQFGQKLKSDPFFTTSIPPLLNRVPYNSEIQQVVARRPNKQNIRFPQDPPPQTAPLYHIVDDYRQPYGVQVKHPVRQRTRGRTHVSYDGYTRPGEQLHGVNEEVGWRPESGSQWVGKYRGEGYYSYRDGSQVYLVDSQRDKYRGGEGYVEDYQCLQYGGHLPSPPCRPLTSHPIHLHQL